MNKIEKQLKKDSNDVYLLRSEQEAMKSSILRNTQERHSPVSIFSFPNLIYRLVPATLVVLLAVGVPVTYASQNSVPGDLLYGFEINIVEEIEEIFYISDNQKVNYHIARLEERLEELKEVADKSDEKTLVALVGGEIQEHTQEIIDVAGSRTRSKEDVNQLVVTSAIINASSDIIDIALNSDPATSSIESIIVLIDDEIDKEITEYISENKNGEDISDQISEDVEDINQFAEEGHLDDVLKIYIDDQLKNANAKILEEDLENTLIILSKTKSEILKQKYLKD